jgi:hypothetical protein
MMPQVNMPELLVHCADPFVGNWGVAQGSQIELKLGNETYNYFLYRDRVSRRVIVQIGQERFFTVDPHATIYDVLQHMHGAHNYIAGNEDELLHIGVRRMFRMDRHGSIDVAVVA